MDKFEFFKPRSSSFPLPGWHGGGIILKMIPLCNIIIDIFILISTVYYKEDINLVLKLILPLKGVLNLRRLYKFEFLVELILTCFLFFTFNF